MVSLQLVNGKDQSVSGNKVLDRSLSSERLEACETMEITMTLGGFLACFFFFFSFTLKINYFIRELKIEPSCTESSNSETSFNSILSSFLTKADLCL